VLLFQKRFHAGLVAGLTTLTFRRWDKPHVKASGRYRCHPIGVLEVSAVALVTVADIDARDAARAGFASLEELVAYLGEVPGKGKVTSRTEVYRVDLRHDGDGDRVPSALDAAIGVDDVKAIKQKLAGFDASSSVGPWTKRTLAAIARDPRVAASRLAEKLGRDTPSFKADVVKLKRLGLTQSFEVGYELSPRGVAFLAASRRGQRLSTR
jgi:hypothetical protein